MRKKAKDTKWTGLLAQAIEANPASVPDGQRAGAIAAALQGKKADLTSDEARRVEQLRDLAAVIDRHVRLQSEQLQERGALFYGTYEDAEREMAGQMTAVINTFAAEGADRLISFVTALAARTLDLVEGLQGEAANGKKRKEGKPITHLDEWSADTSSEATAFVRAYADGASFLNFTRDEQAGIIRHQAPGLRHLTEFRLSDEERRAAQEAGSAGLERLADRIRNLDTDGAVCVHYVLNCVQANVNTADSTWISLDDLINAAGWDPRSAAERREMRARVYDYLLAGTQAFIIGDRGGKYPDPVTKKAIPTVIESRAWSIDDYEWPKQRELYGALEVPLSVGLQPGGEWRKILRQPNMAQYLEGFHRVTKIPGGKAPGAWARSMALCLFPFWRRMAGKPANKRVLPTRRELLTTYPPKLSPPLELLNGKNPGRALEYWRDAVRYLVACGVLADEAEAKAVQTAKKPRGYGWQDAWLDETVDMRPANEALACYREVEKGAQDRLTRRGRPKKLPAA